ncbi:MAG: 50S ribosomal protein L44e [Candidatus Woesearchaeota archaeon]
MKFPKSMVRYCAHCKSHESHKVAPAKKRNASPFSWGSKVRAKLRGATGGTGNKGRYSRKAIGQRKMSGKKITKKTDLRYTCEKCKKTSVQGRSYRAKKVEFA